MSAQFLSSLDLEIDRLEKAVESIPEVQKLRELRRVRALYVGGEGQSKSRSASFIAKLDQLRQVGSEAISAGRKMSPERVRALNFIEQRLANNIVGPVKTVTLLEMLEGAEIQIGGSDPLNNLSALLSTSGRFIAHGRSGWTLKRDAATGVAPLARTEVQDGEQSGSSNPAIAGNGNPGSGEPGQD